MTDREKVISALECCNDPERPKCYKCPEQGPGFGYACRDNVWTAALALLKAQQPRVMTLEEIRVIYHRREDHVWPFDTPPYLWVETNGRTVSYWMSWNNVVACLEGQFPKYDPDDYGKTWRLLTARPTNEQREAEPWNA